MLKKTTDTVNKNTDSQGRAKATAWLNIKLTDKKGGVHTLGGIPLTAGKSKLEDALLDCNEGDITLALSTTLNFVNNDAIELF